MPDQSRNDSVFHKYILPSLLPAGLAFVGSILGIWFTYDAELRNAEVRSREVDVKLIEIAVGILRADPKEQGIRPAREWAVDLINDLSRTKITPSAREALIRHPWQSVMDVKIVDRPGANSGQVHDIPPVQKGLRVPETGQ